MMTSAVTKPPIGGTPVSPAGRAAAPRGIQGEACSQRTGMSARGGQATRAEFAVPEGWRGYSVAAHGEEGGEGK